MRWSEKNLQRNVVRKSRWRRNSSRRGAIYDCNGARGASSAIPVSGQRMAGVGILHVIVAEDSRLLIRRRFFSCVRLTIARGRPRERWRGAGWRSISRPVRVRPLNRRADQVPPRAG
jgi:hypothetical protein